MNTKTSSNTKSKRLYELLKGKIAAGTFQPGTQLPSCRRLAEEFDVSYVTAAQALKNLVGEGLARNWKGKGIFVPDAESEQPGQRLVKLVCSGLDSPSASAFLLEGARIFGDSGWQARQLVGGGPDEVIAELEKDYDSFFILFGFTFANYRLIVEAVERLRAQWRVIVLGERCERYGIASIIADEPQLVRLCMRMLTGNGHRRIGLLCGNIGNSVEQERLAAWRHFYADREWQELFFDMGITAADGDEGEFTAAYLQRQFADGRLRGLDALLCPDPKLAAVALGFFLDHGLRVPDDISIVSIGDADFLTLVRPRVTVVEPGFAAHLKTALEILEERVRGQNTLPLLHLCEPHLIERDSVK